MSLRRPPRSSAACGRRPGGCAGGLCATAGQPASGDGAGCPASSSFAPRLAGKPSLTMLSGGGWDKQIAFACYGATGWGLWYR